MRNPVIVALENTPLRFQESSHWVAIAPMAQRLVVGEIMESKTRTTVAP